MDDDCQLIEKPEAPGEYYCVVCAWETPPGRQYKFPPHRRCSGVECSRRVPAALPGPGEQKRQPPPLRRQAWNLAASLAAFVADGCRTVDAEEYERRLKVCDTCEHRRANRCLKCGCRLAWKARGRAFRCPIGKWGQ